MTRNPATQHVRWLLLTILLFDMAVTLAGQPASFWHDPSTVREDNPLVSWFMHRGPILTVAVWLGFIVGSFGLVTFLPGRWGAIVMYAFILGAFAASSGWVIFQFQFGIAGLYLYSFAVATALVFLMERKNPTRL